MYECLKLSDKYALDYCEIDEVHKTISNQYDFYAFNYHYLTMGWLETKKLRELPGLKICFVLEVAPNDPFVLTPQNDFDVYCVLDPTITIDLKKKVFPFPRPLETASLPLAFVEPSLPTIGSFGFATPGKGFELVVDAVNKEFEKAIIRINIPQGTYTEDAFWHLHNKNYGDYLAEECLKAAKPGIEVHITREFMTKPQLIEWCSQNTLNCFLYNRHQPGLSATTDQAISSGRPLAVSDNETFRHITAYVEPYPLRSLKESITCSQPEVMKMQKDWGPQNFTKKFEKIIEEFVKTPNTLMKVNNNQSELAIKKPKKKYYSVLKKAANIFRGFTQKIYRNN